MRFCRIALLGLLDVLLERICKFDCVIDRYLSYLNILHEMFFICVAQKSSFRLYFFNAILSCFFSFCYSLFYVNIVRLLHFLFPFPTNYLKFWLEIALN